MSISEKNNTPNSRNPPEKMHEGEDYNHLDNASQADFIKHKTDYSSDFNISAIDLENLMGKYKERGNDFQDLKIFWNVSSIPPSSILSLESSAISSSVCSPFSLLLIYYLIIFLQNFFSLNILINNIVLL